MNAPTGSRQVRWLKSSLEQTFSHPLGDLFDADACEFIVALEVVFSEVGWGKSFNGRAHAVPERRVVIFPYTQ